MDPVLKTRLVGASVVILLAVIFLPMILGPGDKGRPTTSEIKLSEQESFALPDRSNGSIQPLGRLAGEKASIDPNAAPANTAEKLATLSEQLTSPSSSEPIEVPSRAVIVPEPAVEIDSAANPSIISSAPQPAIINKNSVASDSASFSGSGFAVQVGSFSDRNRAVVLKDKLQSSGYPAFIESSDDGVMHRVKTGPVGSRDEGSSLLKSMQQDGLVAQGLIVTQAK